MANRTIGSLTPAEMIQDDDLFLLEHEGAAMRLDGNILKRYARESGATVYVGESEPLTESIWIKTNSETSYDGIYSISESGDTITFSKVIPEDTSLMFRNQETGEWEGIPQVGIKGDAGRGIVAIRPTKTVGVRTEYEIVFTDGSTPVKFTVTNGSGLVNTVNGVSVDSSGNVDITGDDINVNSASTKKLSLLDTALNNPNNHTVLIGDSYLMGEIFSNGSYPQRTSWGDYLAMLGGIPSANLHKFDAERSGFIGNGAAVNFYGLIERAERELSQNVRNSTALLVAGGGWNDKDSAEGTIKQTVTVFCEKAKQVFPNARIIISCMGTHLKCEDGSGRRAKVVRAYRDGAISAGCECYEDNWEALHTNHSLICADDCHPTEDGYKALAEWLLAFIKGSPFNPNYADDFSDIVSINSINDYFKQEFVRTGTTVHFNIVTNAYSHGIGAQYFTLPKGYIPSKSTMFPCIIATTYSDCGSGAISVRGYSGDAGVQSGGTNPPVGCGSYRLGVHNGDTGYLVCSGTFDI